MSYAGYPLMGDPLYLPGGVPNTRPRRFDSRKKEDEDLDSDNDDENENDNDNDHEDGEGGISSAAHTQTKTTKRVALPRDC